MDKEKSTLPNKSVKIYLARLHKKHMYNNQSPSTIKAQLEAGAFASADVSASILRYEFAMASYETNDVLVAVCESLLEDREFGMIDDNRISVVKLLIALLPQSYGLIRRWMFLSDDIYYHEVQFTLCCFLRSVLSFVPHDEDVTMSVLALVEEYLYAVTSDEAHNAMMAADMLGIHWRGNEGIDVLFEIVRQPTDSVGRMAAIDTLEDVVRAARRTRRTAPAR